VTVFADLGDEDEWPGTRDVAAGHAAFYGIRHEVVCREIVTPDGRGVPQTLSARIGTRRMWVGPRTRYRPPT
jgi:hypothetical protein